MLMNHSSLNLNGIGKIKPNSNNSQSDNNTNQSNNEDEDGEDSKANILLNGDDLNGDDLIDFGNIPSESAHLTVAPPSLPPPLPNHASSSSGNYSDSSSLSSSSSCSSSIHSVNESLSTIEFEIIKSIESLIDEYNWSAKYAQSDNLLLECKTCDFIINVTYFVHRFKHKLDQNLACNINTLNTQDPLKECTELIQLYLAKLIHIILVRHNCHQTDHADDFLLIKNFFKQLNRHDSTSEASAQLSVSDLLSLIRFKFNEYLNQIMPELRFDLRISEFKSDNCNDASELIDCCALNEEDALLANLDNLMDDDPNNDRLNQAENYDNQFSVPNYDGPQSLNFSIGSSAGATAAPTKNDDNSSILKAINKRKLHLSCPICGSCVVNMSDHLVKKHSIRDRNQRKCLMDVVRRTYINESKVQSSKEPEPSQKKNTTIAHDSSQSVSSTQPAHPQVFTNASNRKFIKCPICLDDNKYFVNISDHLIKIHHLITSDARKPVLRQIKENSLSFNLSKSDFDSMNASATNSFKPNQQTQPAQDKLTEPLNSYNNYQNELILNENIANGSIIINNNNDESIYTNDENNRQCSNLTSTTASTSNFKRKPFKAKKLKNSSLNNSNNSINNNNNEETLRLSNYTRDNQTEDNENENENENEEDDTLIQDEDDDYGDLIAMNCQSLEENTHLVEHNFNEINQFAPSENEFLANANSVSSSRETIANKRKQQNESSLVENTNSNCYLRINDKSKKQKLSPKLLKQQQQYDLALFNEATVVNCLNTSASDDMQQDFEISENVFTYQHSNSQKCNSQLQAVNIKQLSPSIYSCTSPSRSNSAASINTNTTTTLNTAHLDSLWSKFSTMESNLSRQVKEFSVLSESIMKQLQQFSAQFETAVSELDSFKKTLVEATALDEHNNNNSNNNRETVKPKSNPSNFINSTNSRRLNEFSPFTKQKQTNNNNNNFRQAKQTNVEQVMSQFSQQQQQQQQPQ